MAKFSWANFNPDFMKEVLLHSKDDGSIRKRIEKGADEDSLAAMMMSLYEYPDREFILRYRTAIEQYLFPGYKSEVKKICDALNIPGNIHNIRQANLQKKNMTESLADAYIRALLNISGKDVPITEYSKYRQTLAINMRETPIEDVPLYDFQKDAIDALTKFYIDDDKKKGMLVMPTGSGKSRTASYFLIKEMISSGYQVLWIAHRHMLLDQAADCFYKFAGIAKIKKPDIKDYRISCISGEHLTCSQVGKGDEVIVASINSICRNKKQLSRMLDNKVMIVVDEMQHTLAPIYRHTINYIMTIRKNSKLLGLTATPVRANEKDSNRLTKLYDNQIIYEMSMANLIAKGILADPHFITVETEESFEENISSQEKSFIRRFGELPESLVKRIAQSKERNSIILDQYIKHKDEYGKTLIFAMNQVHCRLLAEELNEAGIPCGCVYSKNEDNTRIINDFKEGRFNVMVNVNIMTEGTDVPDIQTVFLTRPTQSEGFLMQMIGRGMRGVNAGGTKTVNIVDFHDKWDVFNKWLNPKWTIAEEKEEYVDPEYKKRIYENYAWSMCTDAYHEMAAVAKETNSYLSVPYCWYSLYDEDGGNYRLIVFEDQKQGYDEFIKDSARWINDDDINIEDAQKVLATYFNYFCRRPSLRDIELMLLNLRDNEEQLEKVCLDSRDAIDPKCVAEKAEREEKDLFEYAGNVYDEYDAARDLFETRENYIMACCHANVYKNNPIKVGTKVEELPIELLELDMTPYYDLQELVDEVVEEMFYKELKNDVYVEWTRKPLKTYFGIHYEDHTILINSVLNSKDVDRETVKFVIYHEFLHEWYPKHNREFREKERMYPNSEYHDHVLDTMFKKYSINLNN